MALAPVNETPKSKSVSREKKKHTISESWWVLEPLLKKSYWHFRKGWFWIDHTPNTTPRLSIFVHILDAKHVCRPVFPRLRQKVQGVIFSRTKYAQAYQTLEWLWFHGAMHDLGGKRCRWHRSCWWFKNPVNSPVEVGSLSQYLQGFLHPRWWSPDFWTINSMKSRLENLQKITFSFYSSGMKSCLPLMLVKMLMALAKVLHNIFDISQSVPAIGQNRSTLLTRCPTSVTSKTLAQVVMAFFSGYSGSATGSHPQPSLHLPATCSFGSRVAPQGAVATGGTVRNCYRPLSSPTPGRLDLQLGRTDPHPNRRRRLVGCRFAKRCGKLSTVVDISFSKVAALRLIWNYIEMSVLVSSCINMDP